MSYIDYDEFGIVAVHCMKCGETVAIRSYSSMTSREDPTKEVNVMTVQKLSNWRQGRKVTVYSGEGKEKRPEGYIEPILCSTCIETPLEEKDILAKVKRAWTHKYEQYGLSKEEIVKKVEAFHGRLKVKEDK